LLDTLLLLVGMLVAYVWVGYPVLLWILRRVRTRPPVRHGYAPSVSMVVAVHNEEHQIAEKLENCLALRCDSLQRFEVVVVSDGSTDHTEEIVKQQAVLDPRLRLLRTERMGKSGAQNFAAQNAKGEILVFSDAGTRMQPGALQALVENFADPQVGLATGVVYFGHPGEAVLKGQGFYWRYEFFLRQAESDIGILATATGTALAIRRDLFRPLSAFHGDDCVLPLDVRLQGFQVLQEPNAVVYDVMPNTIEGELHSRIRMTCRNWTGTLSRPALLNPLRFPGTALALLSHKLLRWLTPLCLACFFLLNTVLLLRGRHLVLWCLQALFYSGAAVGWLAIRKKLRAGVFAYPFTFCLANLGFLLGLLKVLRNEKISSYRPVG
jgi:cellulose synthase/poly-beta-1,6-N-acetylglucosamine synthase-like glycosyltransferase